MENYIKKDLYDNTENSWEFVLEVSEMYKKEFAKTSKIGQPPKIDDVITKAIKIRLGENIIEADKVKEEEVSG